MKSDMSKLKTVGLIITAISVLSFIALLYVSLDIAEAKHLACPGVISGCTVLGHFPYSSFFGMGALIFLMITGLWISTKARDEISFTMKSDSDFMKTVGELKGDDKVVYNMLVDNEGTMFQNELIKGIGYSKVKVSRLLDRLEMKNIIERRRRGMANLIVLKK